MKGDIVRGVNKRHEESEEMLSTWEKCKDVREGQTAVHEAGDKYLPKLSGQPKEEYAAYKRRAVFYGAFSRTVDAFKGMILRTHPTVDTKSPLLDDVTNDGHSVYEIAGEILEASFVSGFSGILVEHTRQTDGIVTMAQAEQAGQRPYLALFDDESIINWKKDKSGFSQVVLCEEAIITVTEFEQEEQEQYRVLDIDSTGFYRQRVFIETKKKGEFVQIDNDIYPTINGQKLREIPFYFAGCADELPPLIDLVDLNISHYMTTADLENGCHYTGIPQPWVAGAQLEPGSSLRIGGVTAWVFPDPHANANYLEFSGHGLGSLADRLVVKEKQMAALGAKMLSDTVVAETATGSSLRSSGEFSVLANIANDTSKVLSRACSFMHKWAGLGDVSIKLNTDYLPQKMTPQELQALVAAWQAGALSYQSLYAQLVQGEVIEQGSDAETEQAQIGNAAPVLVAPVGG